jgi:hypothetical protein
LGINNELHGAESFRSRQSLSHSRSSRHFMEPECSLSCSQEPAAGLWPEPDESTPYPLFYISKINFNIIISSASRSSCFLQVFFLGPDILLSTLRRKCTLTVIKHWCIAASRRTTFIHSLLACTVLCATVQVFKFKVLKFCHRIKLHF